MAGRYPADSSLASRMTSLCRLNTKLASHSYPPMSNLFKDLSDGVRLIQLMVRPPSTALGIALTASQEIMGMSLRRCSREIAR
jgi:hypothetical protein